jgi:hypothetical protein
VAPTATSSPRVRRALGTSGPNVPFPSIQVELAERVQPRATHIEGALDAIATGTPPRPEHRRDRNTALGRLAEKFLHARSDGCDLEELLPESTAEALYVLEGQGTGTKKGVTVPRISPSKSKMSASSMHRGCHRRRGGQREFGFRQ